jgi:hypothetical protein
MNLVLNQTMCGPTPTAETQRLDLTPHLVHEQPQFPYTKGATLLRPHVMQDTIACENSLLFLWVTVDTCELFDPHR